MSPSSAWNMIKCQDEFQSYFGERRIVTLERLKQNRMSWTLTRLMVLLVLVYFNSSKACFIL